MGSSCFTNCGAGRAAAETELWLGKILFFFLLHRSWPQPQHPLSHRPIRGSRVDVLVFNLHDPGELLTKPSSSPSVSLDSLLICDQLKLDTQIWHLVQSSKCPLCLQAAFSPVRTPWAEKVTSIPRASLWSRLPDHLLPHRLLPSGFKSQRKGNVTFIYEENAGSLRRGRGGWILFQPPDCSQLLRPNCLEGKKAI